MSTSFTSPVNRFKKTHIRWWLAVFFFILGVISYMDRANLSYVAETMMMDLHMDKIQFGILGSVFSLGYAISQIPSGIIAERFGSRSVITVSLTIWSLFTVLTAVVPKYIYLCVVRFLFGVGEAPIFPGNAVFNTYWFRREEKARAAGLLTSGTYFGPVIAPYLTVFIMMNWSWHMVFYVFGAVGFIAAVIWYFIARNKPEEHSWVSPAELEYIKQNRTVEIKQEKVSAPWRHFFRRSDFWGVGLHYFFVGYMTVLFLVWLPTFLQEARGFSLVHMGIGASLPWLCICVAVLGGGTLSDRLLKRGRTSLFARGTIAIFGLVLFIVGVIGTAFTSDKIMTVFWLCITLGSLGFPVVCSWAIAADKGRQYSGSVSGWMNLWGNLGGVISPIICGAIAQYFSWTSAILFNILPILLAIICWILIKPDRPMTEDNVG